MMTNNQDPAEVIREALEYRAADVSHREALAALDSFLDRLAKAEQHAEEMRAIALQDTVPEEFLDTRKLLAKAEQELEAERLENAVQTTRASVAEQERDEAKELLWGVLGTENPCSGCSLGEDHPELLSIAQARTFLNQEHPECPRNTSAEEGDTDGGS